MEKHVFKTKMVRIIFASMFYKRLNSLIIEKDFASKFHYKIVVTNLTSERVTKVKFKIHMFL